MSINAFFISISVILLMIFIGFKPLDIKQQEFIDVPLFQIKDFTLYELDKNGLATLMKGSEATRYDNRYKVANINYTDNSKKYVINMKADNGTYTDKDGILNLKGDILYNREDGFIFETDEASYNKNTSIVETDKDYILYKDYSRVIGSSFKYNNYLNRIKSTNVVARYELNDGEL